MDMLLIALLLSVIGVAMCGFILGMLFQEAVSCRKQ